MTRLELLLDNPGAGEMAEQLRRFPVNRVALLKLSSKCGNMRYVMEGTAFTNQVYGMDEG